MWLHADSCDALYTMATPAPPCGLRWRVTEVTPTPRNRHTHAHTHTHVMHMQQHLLAALPPCAPLSQITRPLIHAHSLGSRGFLASDFACRWASLLKRVGSFIRYSCASSASGVRPVTWSTHRVAAWAREVGGCSRRLPELGREAVICSIHLSACHDSIGGLPICLSAYRPIRLSAYPPIRLSAYL